MSPNCANFWKSVAGQQRAAWPKSMAAGWGGLFELPSPLQICGGTSQTKLQKRGVRSTLPDSTHLFGPVALLGFLHFPISPARQSHLFAGLTLARGCIMASSPRYNLRSRNASPFLRGSLLFLHSEQEMMAISSDSCSL